jgi:D-alanyl-D-alanine carboxypeptidase
MKTPIKQLSLVLAIALCSCHHDEKEETKAHSELDNFIESKMKELHIPALSYAVMQNGEYISSGVYGLAEVELNVPANEHTLFNVGSVGKTFTATAIMLLEEEGKLSIKDPIAKHLEGIPESWNNITIEHLLNHTSGIKDYVQDHPSYTLLPNIDRAVELTPEQYIEMCTSNPLNFPTGTRWAYSNSNYALLGFIIRKHIDTSMDEFMRKKVFEPADMMDTRYEAAFELRPNRAKGYHWDSTGVKNGALISNFYSTIGDCGILTTGKDLAKWAPALVSGKVVSKSQVEKMWTKHQLNDGKISDEEYITYGLGWHIDDVMGKVEYGHNGALMKGYTGFYRYYPEFDLSIAMTANRWVGAQIFDFYDALADRFLPEEIKFSAYSPSEGTTAATWKEKMKTFGTTLAESGDLSPIAEQVYVEILKEYEDTLNVEWGKSILASKIEFLHERDLSQKQVLKHGQKATKLGLFAVSPPFLPENSIVYYSLYLSEGGKLLGTSFKLSLKD